MFNSTVKYLMASLIFCTENNTYRGNWTTEGCKLNTGKSNIISGQFVCECTHLTNFAVMVVSLTITFFFFSVLIVVNTSIHVSILHLNHVTYFITLLLKYYTRLVCTFCLLI